MLEGLFWTFEINIEYISADVSLGKVKTLEPLLRWWSWIIRLVVFSWDCFVVNFHPLGTALIACSLWN